MCVAGEKKKPVKPATGTPSPKLNGQFSCSRFYSRLVQSCQSSSIIDFSHLLYFGLVYFVFVCYSFMNSAPLHSARFCSRVLFFLYSCQFYCTILLSIVNNLFSSLHIERYINYAEVLFLCSAVCSVFFFRPALL